MVGVTSLIHAHTHALTCMPTHVCIRSCMHMLMLRSGVSG